MRMRENQKKYIALGLVLLLGASGVTALSLLRGQETPIEQKAELTLNQEVLGLQEELLDERAEETEDDTYPQGSEDEAEDEKEPEVTAQEEKNTQAEQGSNEEPVEGSAGPSHAPITTNQYVVQENDTLYLIAQRAGLTVAQLKSYNNMNSDTLLKGQVLSMKALEGSSSPSGQETASRGNREEDLYWLSRIIHAEAQGEPYEGKVAVGNVILNRVKSSLFPNSIKGVVFDKQQGYTQFSPVLDGSIYNTPNSDSINAARDALNGSRPVGDALYFLNPGKSTNFWIVQNRKFMKTIGDHDFYY